jgi:hypothetical protein
MNNETLKHLADARDLLKLAASSLRQAHKAESAVAMHIDEFLAKEVDGEEKYGKEPELDILLQAQEDEDMFS